MDLEERLLLDAIATAWSIGARAVDRLHEQLCELGSKSAKKIDLDHSGRAQLAIDVWSLVDAVDNLRRFISQLPEHGELAVGDFLAASRVAKILRDRMAHRSEQGRNQAKRKSIDPIFGVLCFMTPAGPDGRWAVHQIALSGTHHDSYAFPAIDTWASPTGDISHVSLSAFDQIVDLVDLWEKALFAIGCIEKWAEKTIVDTVKAHCLAAGVDPDEALAERSGLTLTVSAHFGAERSDCDGKTEP